MTCKIYLKGPKWPKMIYVIKDTVDIYCFCKKWYETAQEHLLFKLPQVSLKKIEKFLHFSFRTVESFYNTKPPRKFGENPISGSENVWILGGCQAGDGRTWNWVMNYSNIDKLYIVEKKMYWALTFYLDI